MTQDALAALSVRTSRSAETSAGEGINPPAADADAHIVSFVLRHTLSLVVVGTALVAVAAVFVFARPQYEPRYESRMIDFSKQHYSSPRAVRAAFLAAGIRVRVASQFNGIVTMSDAPRPVDADALQVVVGPRAGTASFGPKLAPYDVRFGNVLVTYGGTDRRVIAQLDDAVARLR